MKIEEYFKEIEKKVKEVYSVAEEARRKGLDPLSKVEVPLAMSLAEKVTGLISSVYPQLNDKRIVDRILELEKEHGQLDVAVAFKIAEEIAKEKFCKFSSLLEAIDAGIRVGFAYVTLGVVSSPIEGYTELKLGKTRNGEDYFVAFFSGPIRSAGTTAGCVALMLIDYLRETFGYAKYDADEKEIRRYVTENYDYHERVTNLQYLPTEEEIVFLASNLPIQISGEPTEQKEVSNYKDLDRVETNFIRGGMCLIFSEGLAQKAQKGLRLLRGLQAKGFKISSWEFLEEYIGIHKKRVSGDSDTTPTYIKDLVAGRPVFSHPSRSGGLRFRYGRSRVNGFSAVSVHPATMAMSDCFLSTGVQLKIEKPTKGCVITSCDSIDGPIVKLRNGSVRKIDDYEEAKRVYKDVIEIIYLGDILFPVGDVINRNYELLKPGYVEEWWKLELEALGVEVGEVDLNKAIELSEKHNVPLYPKYIFYWSQINYDEFLALVDWLSHGFIEDKIVLPYNKTEQERFKQGKRALELLGVEHHVSTENVVIGEETSKALMVNLGVYGIKDWENISMKIKNEKNVLEAINKISKFKIKDKAGVFIGARMGRPEKAKLRKLIGSPNVLFPVGDEGGRLRSVNAAVEVGSIKADFPIYNCRNCQKETIYFKCEDCGNECEKMRYCPDCQQKFSMEKCPEHLKGLNYMTKRIDSKHYLQEAIKKLNLLPDEVPKLIKGVRGTSNRDHELENLVKGILRARHKLCVNKDGTIRYDATELPITHFKPKEVMTHVEMLRDLGYEKDVYGMALESDEQILELKPHDIILPSCPESQDERADDVFFSIACFIDDLLEKFYGLKAFYRLESKEDLIGQLVVCMAPHNCAGVIGRIVGFSKIQGLFASPYMHAAMRRDCLGYDSYVSVKKEGIWKVDKIGNFIEQLKPDVKIDNFTFGKKISDIYTSSNPGESEIVEATKHSPRKMLKLFLEDGRKIEATESHRFYTKGKIEKRALELKEGDKLMINYKRNIEEKDIKEIFLPEIFDGRKEIVIRNVREYLDNFEKPDKSSNFYQRDSFPIIFVKDFLKKHNKNLQDLPDKTRIGFVRDKISIPIRVPLDNDLLEIIGLYIAEGFTRKNSSEKGFYQISIASKDNFLKDKIEKAFYSHFCLKPSEKHEEHLTFSSRIVYELFENYLAAGNKAANKRIPCIFLNLKKEKVASLLRGYFEGDGSVSSTDIRVCCDTISEGLKFDLSFVLSRFGIFTKFYEYEKEPGEAVRSFYLRKGRKVPKFKITKIIIPSNFVSRFKEIGFLSDRKNKILEEILKGKPYGMKIDFDENYVYPEIKKIEQLGEKESYCFNVSSAHNFFANDVLVHNCDGDEAAVMLLLDVLLNFSRKFLPSHRGGTQDAPLVLNARIRAGEVDEQILDFELGKYSLALYELAEQGKHSSEVKIETVRSRLKEGKETFSNIFFTHDSSNFNLGVINSSYKTLPTMQEKVARQMELVEKLRAVDTTDVARLIIDRHFIRDIRGNLRKFSQQEFRCSKCNEKYRRPPLAGRCWKCSGNIIFTISEGSIVKYLEPALQLANKYNVPAYIKQSLELTKSYIESIFGKEKEKQESIARWF
jgi:DNA polymerase II large subunit